MRNFFRNLQKKIRKTTAAAAKSMVLASVFIPVSLTLAALGCADVSSANRGLPLSANRLFGGSSANAMVLPNGATITGLAVTPGSWTGWAVHDMVYFSVTPTWSDGVPDPDCNRAGQEPQWTCTYGWFEDEPSGINRMNVPVAEPENRYAVKSGPEVIWSSEFDTRRGDADTGTITVSYGGLETVVDLTAYKPTNNPNAAHPIPHNYMLNTVLQEDPFDESALMAWYNENDIKSSAWWNDQTTRAHAASSALADYIEDWLDGNADPELPENLLEPSLQNYKLKWKLYHPDELPDMEEVFYGRLARKQSDIPDDMSRSQYLYSDYNASYICLLYMAPFGSTMVIEGEFPRTRFFDIQASIPFDPYFPASIGNGQAEVPIVDADIEPLPGHTNPFRVGANRNATDRSYRVYYKMSEGNACTLNENLYPGSMTDRNTVAPYRSPGSTENTRIGGPFRCGGAFTRGELLPGQLWIRYYGPDNASDPYGMAGVPLPKVYFLTPNGEKFMLVAERKSVNQFFNRRRNGYYPVITSGDPNEGPAYPWKSGIGWMKMFGIGRIKLEMEAREKLYVTKSMVRDFDLKTTGRGNGEELPGGLECSATACNYINYTVRKASIQSGNVLIITGKLFSTPDTRNGAAIMSGADMRYISLTHYADVPYSDNNSDRFLMGTNLGTVMDDEIVTDANGNYIICFSRAADRPANANPENGVTWVDWGDISKQDLVWRYLSVGPDWHDPTYAPDYDNMPWDTAGWTEDNFDDNLLFNNSIYNYKRFMDEYHPVLHYAGVSDFEGLGASPDPYNIPWVRNWR